MSELEALERLLTSRDLHNDERMIIQARYDRLKNEPNNDKVEQAFEVVTTTPLNHKTLSTNRDEHYKFYSLYNRLT